MKTPFPFFGGKGRIAPEVWKRFGDPAYYFEPFGGAIATLLGRPAVGKYEHVGDTYCLIANFLRAAKYGDPRDLAVLAEWPTSQLELEARNKWLQQQHERLHRLLTDDPKAYDLECAAWYAWTQSVRTSPIRAVIIVERNRGVRCHIEDLPQYFAALTQRLKKVVICYGDWTRMAKSAERNSRHSDCAILLDPPYGHGTGREKGCYVHDSPDVSAYVRRWALARAKTHPRLRLALCGLDGEHKMPCTWEELPWWSRIGRGRERIWFSPNCLK